MTQRGLIVALLCSCLLLTGLATRNRDVTLLSLPFLVYLAAGILRAPSVDEPGLAAERAVTREMERTEGDTWSVAGEMRITIRNASGQAVLLRLVEPVQPGLEPLEWPDLERDRGVLSGWLVLGAGEERAFRYAFAAPRGRYRWQAIRVIAADPFGLFASELMLPALAELEVQPRAGKYRTLSLPPCATLHSPGTLPARLAGSGTDFWGVREYYPGDPLRRIDWHLAARHPGRFFTREFEQEEVADTGIILDARCKADIRLGNESLFEHSVRAAGSLAETLLSQGHRVSLLVFGDALATVFPGYSRVQLQRIRHCLANAKVGLTDSRVTLGYLPLGMFSTRALMVIFSSLAPGDRVLFGRLRARGNQVVLVCPDAVAFATPGVGPEMADRLALRASRAERRLELRKVAAEHVCVVDWSVDRPLAPLLQDALRAGRSSLGRRGAIR